MKFELLKLTSAKPIPKKGLLAFVEKYISAEPGGKITKLGPGVFLIWEPEIKFPSEHPKDRQIYVGSKRRPHGPGFCTCSDIFDSTAT